MKTLRLILVSLGFVTGLWAQEMQGPGWIVFSAEEAEPPLEETGPGIPPEQSSGELAANSLAGSAQSAGNDADAATADIESLARGLNYAPSAIFFWVRDNISFQHYYGVHKGAGMTLLERSGNDADTAALLVSLLRQCPTVTSAQYMNGFTTVPAVDAVNSADLPHWLGCTAASYAENMVTVGGTPAADFIKVTTGSVVTYAWKRWWVRATLAGGAVLTFDPSFKRHQQVAGINLATATGFSRLALLSAAGGTLTSPSVQGLSETAINTSLTGNVTALVNWLKTNNPHLSASEMLGGWLSLASASTADAGTYFPLAVDTVRSGTITPVDALPTSLISTLQVQAGSINVTKSLASLQGQTLWLSYSGPNSVASLTLGDTVLATEASASGPLIAYNVTVTHAAASHSQTTNTFVSTRHGVRTLVYGFTPTGAQMRAHQTALETMQSATPAPVPERIRAEAQAVIGYAWLNQTRRSEAMLDSLTGLQASYQHRVGFVVDDYDPASVTGGYVIDVKLQMLSVAARQPNVDYAAATGTMSMIQSSMEDGVLTQMQNGRLAASTVSVIAANNAAGAKTFLASSSNWSAIQPQLSNYSASQLNDISTKIAATGTVLLPADGRASINAWKGNGYLAIYASGSHTTFEFIISGSYYGGYAGTQESIYLPAVTQQQTYQTGRLNFTPVSQSMTTAADPIDMASGQYTFDASDLVVGGGSLPRGLNFGRHYHGARKGQNLHNAGYGWTHSLGTSVATRSDVETALGDGSALDTATFVTGLYAAWQTLTVRSTVKDWTVALLAAKWAVGQLYNNAVTVAVPDRILEFHKLPNGTYLPPPGITATLSLNGSNQYVVQERHSNTWTFDSTGKLITVTDPWSKTATFAYDASQRLSSVTDCYGRSLTLTYDAASDLLTSVSDSTGRSVSFTYDTTAKTLTQATDVEGKATFFEYDAARRLTGMKDHGGHYIVENIAFDSQDRVTLQRSQGDNARMWNQYYAPGQTLSENPLNQQTTYLFDQRNRAIATVDALGHTSRASFDGQDHMIQNVSALGFVTAQTYDASHNPLITTDALNNTTTRAFNASNELTSVTDRNGKVTTLTGYNAQHQPGTVTDPAGVASVVTYVASGPAAGAVQTVTVGGQLKVTNAYDSYGNLSSITRGNGATTTTETRVYNVRGDVTSVTNARGFTTTFTYNQRRQVLTTTSPGSLAGDPAVTVTKTYDDHGNVATATDALGHMTSFTYTILDKPLTTTLPDGAVTSIAYDLADRPITTTDPTGRMTTSTLDAAGRATAVTDPAGHVTTTGFDDDSRPITLTDANALTTTTLYNARAEAVKVTNADNAFSSRTYDNEGRPATVTTRNGSVWTMQYDFAGRPSGLTSAQLRSATTYYDTQGRVSERREPSNQSAKPVYDALDRVTSLEFRTVYSQASPAFTIGTTFNANGLPLTITEGSAVLTRMYDQRDQVASYTTAANETLGYRYDAAGRLTQLTLPDGKTLTYGFDLRDRLTSITDWAGRVSTLAYDAAGRLLSVTRPNGTTRTLTYDTAGRLQEIEERRADHHFITLVRLGYDAGGRLTRRFVVPLPSAATSFSAMSNTFTADDFLSGALTDADGNQGIIPAVPSGSYGLTTVVQSSPGIKVFTASLQNTTWDQRNRLTFINLVPSGGLTCTYDAENLRLSKGTSTGNTTRYTQNPHGLGGMSEVVIQTDPDGTKHRYVWGGPAGLLYEERSDGTLRFYHSDQVGSTLALTDSTGAVTGRTDYTAYGLQTRREGDLNTPFLFNGASGVMTDYETGLVLMRARYYHPRLGRFVSQDPIGFEGGLNMFGYAGGSPLGFLDPSGLDREAAFRTYDWATLNAAVPQGDDIPYGTMAYVQQRQDDRQREQIRSGVNGLLIMATVGEMAVARSGVALLTRGASVGTAERVAANSGGLYSTIGGKGMDPALFSRIQTAFERTPGRVMASNAASELHLGPNLLIEGETLSTNVIALRMNPSTSSVYEELIHTAQLRRGMTNVTQMEIEAAQKLIRFAEQYKIPASETAATVERLRILQGGAR